MAGAGGTGRRLFVAIELPDEVRAHLAAEVERVHATVEPAAVGRSRLGVRWSDPGSWHLTLVFCGTVPPAAEASFVSALGPAAAEHRALRLGIAGGGRFGQRVLWAGVVGDQAGLVALAGSVADRARGAGIAVEQRPYRPHLTIARGSPGADLAPAAGALAGYVGPTWVADQVVLIESVLGGGPGGTARHVVVQAFPLGAG